MNPQLSSDLVTFAPYRYGFPRYRGGLIEFADSTYPVAILADICIFT